MKKIVILLLGFMAYFPSFSQVPDKYEYPDTLWVYGTADDAEYGVTPQNPIRVGGGILPKNNYRYLNSLTDSNGARLSYNRLGSCCSEELGRALPLTMFSVQIYGEEVVVYFDQHEWERPLLVKGFSWKERRRDYYGEYSDDTTFGGYGIYFFEDGGYYRGDWKDGIMDRYGVLYIPERETYQGQFVNGKYSGKGTLEYNDGGKYIGEFEGDLRNGIGRLYYPDGMNVKYIEGTFIDGDPSGHFKVVKSDGSLDSMDL
ncbi:hypothetical protein [Owenweeksia hongkongensis]|uniref:hypothetical protein n=1 Tax=Owenweeksia hongkongensis TaxID=253245 RepID=UPI003A8F030B